jgi:VIT1/CCC1 family predicted Fe2+/Mn2+ transporter
MLFGGSPLHAARMASGTARSVMGEAGYQSAKTAGTYAYTAFAGFVPVVPIFWIPQLIIFLTIMFVSALIFDVSWGKSAFAGYIIQALIITFVGQKLTSFGLGLIGI